MEPKGSENSPFKPGLPGRDKVPVSRIERILSISLLPWFLSFPYDVLYVELHSSSCSQTIGGGGSPVFMAILSVGFPGGSDGKESACNVGDPVSVSGLGRSPGERNGNPLQYSCLENPMDRGIWQSI